MKHQDSKELLSGIIEIVTYHNRDNGFYVIRVKVTGHRHLVTITGNTQSISAGERIKCQGSWYNDRNHGMQFKADILESLPPDTLEGIEKYLASGLIKGIGTHLAQKLVLTFGDKVFDVIEHKSDLLSTIDGIGKVRAQSICDNWQDQKIIRKIMVFLQSHGIGTARAVKIYKTYGERAIEIVSQNPYQLAKDISGIGFISADKIASNLGIAKNSLARARAGIAHVLLEATSDGHCGLPKAILIEASQKLLEVAKDLVESAIDEEIKLKSLVASTINNTETIFLTSYYVYEHGIAKILLRFTQSPAPLSTVDSGAIIPSVEKELNIQLAESQKVAIHKALETRVMVITGGPGTGKTTLVNALLRTLATKNLSIKLCAPTGRAAKRLSESTGLEATTIHRLLEIDYATYGGFKRNEEYQLSCDYLVIDEASMVDVPLFYSLLKALPLHSGLLLIGDIDQLPSVGAGQVLKDIIDSKIIPTVRLTEIFRQAATSKIITNAHLVNKGILPDMQKSEAASDFYFVSAEPGDDIINKIITIIQSWIPKKFNLDPINDIQLLCPMQRGGTGTRSLNAELQKALNPNYSKGVPQFGQVFAIGDKIMQTENNYDKDIYNGDIGIIKEINDQDQEVMINFYNRNVTYDYADLDQITLAYATTIHKSQGSEYKAVIIPITMQSYIMLRRNLIYTAITRGKQLVVLIGQKKALAIAVNGSSTSLRYSKLKEWLIA